MGHFGVNLQGTDEPLRSKLFARVMFNIMIVCCCVVLAVDFVIFELLSHPEIYERGSFGFFASPSVQRLSTVVHQVIGIPSALVGFIAGCVGLDAPKVKSVRNGLIVGLVVLLLNFCAVEVFLRRSQ